MWKDPLYVCKKTSDILDSFVGGTEQNIKEAFEEAESEESVLIIDEVDSLLFSRDFVCPKFIIFLLPILYIAINTYFNFWTYFTIGFQIDCIKKATFFIFQICYD